MGLGINHLLTNVFTPDPYPGPVEALGVPGTPQGYVGEGETLHKCNIVLSCSAAVKASTKGIGC